MAYNETLAARVRQFLPDTRLLTERKMFGGIAFMLKGNMCCGILHDALIVRVPPEQYDVLLQRKHTRKFAFTGRIIKGFIIVTPKGTHRADSLKRWLSVGSNFAGSLPRKK